MPQPSVLRRIAEHFVNRKFEIETVEDKIESLRLGGPLLQVVVNFHGVIGIGKTMLIRELYKRARGRGIPSALVDFARDGRYADTTAGRVNVLEDLATDLAAQSDLQPREFSRQATLFWQLHRQHPEDPHPAKEEAVGKLTDLLVRYAKDLLERKGRFPVVLCFDTTEEAPDSLIPWLEASLFVPLLRTDQVIIVLAGRSPVKWRTFEVRRRTYTHLLHPFDEGMVAEQLDAYRPLATVIREVTFGHPRATREAATAVYGLEQQDKQQIDSESFEEHYRARVVRQVVQSLLYEEVLKDVKEQVQQAFLWLSPLRRCDVDIAATILSQIASQDPSSTAGFPAREEGAFYLGLISEMVRTLLMRWDPTRKAYAIDDTIRHILALDLKLHQEDSYKAVHEMAIDLYRDWIEHVPENRSGYLVEILFHRTCLWNVEKPGEDLSSLLRTELEPYLDSLRGETIEGLAAQTRLWYELRDDDELKELWGAEIHNLLLESIGPPGLS